MKIYISHSREFDFVKDLYNPIKASNLAKEYEFILPHDGSDQPFLNKDSLKNHEIDLIIAEISFPSTGQGIELGWASVYKVPIECIYKKGKKYSNSLTTVSSHFTEYGTDLIQKIEGFMRDYGI